MSLAQRLPLVCLLVGHCLWLLPTSAQASPELARKYNCTGCHAAERKLVGPAYRDVASRYAASLAKAEQATVNGLALSIRAGGAGRWGPVPMPAQPRLSEADAKTLAAWILATPSRK